MIVDRLLQITLAVIGLSCAMLTTVIVIVKFNRDRSSARSRALLATYRHALIAMASGEDEDGRAKTVLDAVDASTWKLLRPSVVAFLSKVQGSAVDNLGELLRSHGEIKRATRMLTSRSAVQRARAVYLLGLVRDPNLTTLVLPLLNDSDADVRLVAARALGTIGEASAAGGILHALRISRRRIGLPAFVAVEALLAMGAEIAPALDNGLTSNDATVRNVCALVAGYGSFFSTAPKLCDLLATPSEGDIRISAAMALGQVGDVNEIAILARHTNASEATKLRRACVTALGDMGRREGLDTLVGLLGDGDRRLAQIAADSLVRSGPEGMARLAAAAVGQSPCARAARSALDLAELRGQLAPTQEGVL